MLYAINLKLIIRVINYKVLMKLAKLFHRDRLLIGYLFFQIVSRN